MLDLACPVSEISRLGKTFHLPMSHDVFISYSTKDKKFSQALCHALENAGIKCWMAPRDIKAGEKWSAAIKRAIETCRLMLLVYTKDSNVSDDVLREVGLAAKNKKTIIPFGESAEKVPMNDGLEYYLNADHWLEAHPDWRLEFSELIQTVKHYLGPIAPPKPSPESLPPTPPPPPVRETAATPKVTVESEKRVANVANTQSPNAGKAWTVPELNLEMVPIAAGMFQMGSDNGRDSEKPVHTVRITKPFWLGRYQVTQGQWEALMGNNPSHFKNIGKNAPVENVSWIDAMEFCRKLTERERATGRLPEGYAYILPTEAQWEYACRAGTTGDYSRVLDEMGWYQKNSDNQTHPVGQKKANAWGLYDMHGNVWEWCFDWYDIRYYANSPSSDPYANSPGSDRLVLGSYRIIRGGSYSSTAEMCQSPFRSGGVTGKITGFRLALSAVGGEEGK